MNHFTEFFFVLKNYPVINHDVFMEEIHLNRKENFL